jgi:hypothetical protein
LQAIPLIAGLIDNADDPRNCTIPYQLSIIDPGGIMSGSFPQVIDVNEMVDNMMSSGSYPERLAKATILLPFAMVITFVISMFGKAYNSIIEWAGGTDGKLKLIAIGEFMLNLCNTAMLGGLRKFKRIQAYTHDFTYPTGIPTPSEAGSAWLGGEIDDCTFEAYVKAGDSKFEPFKAVVKSGKFKLTPLELVALDKRDGMLRGDLRARLREQGVLYDSDQQELLNLFIQVPGPGDIVRFMQRDVVNPNVVNTFGLDDGFTDNFQGRLKEWADQQGVTEEQMRMEWRAHWSIPSPTQLYVMLHRLRHDPDFGGPQKVEQDVETALKQQDILPYWIPRLMKVSYHALTRTDLNRAFERGWVDEDAYVDGMYQNGYSDDDAKTLLRFAVQERKLAIRNNPLMHDFASGYISGDQLWEGFAREGYSVQLAADVSEEAEYRRTVVLQRRNVDAIASQYKACRISLEEAKADAAELGIPPEVFDLQIGIAENRTLCGTKKERASTLCQALTDGFITESDYVKRMKELKYDDTAIETYLALCNDAAKRRRAKAELKAQKDAEREAQREAKAVERAERQAAGQAQRLQKLIEQQERRRQTRNAQLMSAANRLGTHLADISSPPTELVDSLFHGLQELRNLSQDEAAKVLSLTAGSSKGMSTDEYIKWVYAVALDALADPWSIAPPGVPLAETTG